MSAPRPSTDDSRHLDSAVFIVNPKAGAGRAGRGRSRLKDSIHRHFSNAQIWPTERPGHATELARRACEQGARTIVAVGGDGTCHEVVNGLMGQNGQTLSDVVFATVPLGTGSDLQKSLNLPAKLDDAAEVAAWPSSSSSQSSLSAQSWSRPSYQVSVASGL